MKSGREKQLSLRKLLFLMAASLLIAGILWAFWPAIQCWRVRSMLAAGDLNAAHLVASQTAASYAGCGECFYLQARANRRLGHFDEAETALRRASELQWNSADILREQVLSVAQRGGIASVERRLQEVFRSDLGSTETNEVYEAMAYGHLAAFDIPEFLKCIAFWLEWNPPAIAPRMMRADYYRRVGNFSEAAKDYSAIAQADSSQHGARLGWGECLLNQNRPDEAIEQLQWCLDDQPAAGTAVLLAKALIQVGRNDEAGAVLKRFQEDPNVEKRGEVLEQLGRWHFDRGQTIEAEAILKLSVAAAPESASAWHALASVQTKLGNLDGARNSLATSQDVQARVSRLAELINELSSRPKELPQRIEAAQILFEQGMNSDAVAWLKTVLAQDLHHVQANQLLAEFYEKNGQPELANQHRHLGNLPLP